MNIIATRRRCPPLRFSAGEKSQPETSLSPMTNETLMCSSSSPHPSSTAVYLD